MDIADVQTVAFTAGETTFTITPELPEYSDVDASNANDSDTNGSEADEDSAEAESTDAPMLSEKADDLWTKLQALTATGLCAEEPSFDNPLLTVNLLMKNGKSAELVFASWNVDSYVLSMTGHPDRLVSANDVDTLLRLLRSAE